MFNSASNITSGIIINSKFTSPYPMPTLPQWISQHPRQLFLVDGIGAVVSALLWGVVGVRVAPWVGIPVPTMLLLALLPGLFSVYDFYHFFQRNQAVRVPLRGIAAMNVGYCGLSAVLAIYHYETLTTWGWAYIGAELIIVLALARLEYRVAG